MTFSPIKISNSNINQYFRTRRKQLKRKQPKRGNDRMREDVRVASTWGSHSSDFCAERNFVWVERTEYWVRLIAAKRERVRSLPLIWFEWEKDKAGNKGWDGLDGVKLLAYFTSEVHAVMIWPDLPTDTDEICATFNTVYSRYFWLVCLYMRVNWAEEAMNRYLTFYWTF